ncbi:hypothetical protein BV898_18613 [Hypsibius exemplaris]|uniref:Uncharacterized protein n=1 Tax=Hypsibius exemplaris TaxID=2072580 RepID=A0A9X6RP08_HYPEX|nr:hypothetical protein BV898_18613 [Hypsibius exemplaris]
MRTEFDSVSDSSAQEQEPPIFQKTSPVEPTWWITENLYELSQPKAVYDAVVKAHYPAVFLNSAMVTGNSLDLQIAVKKAISKLARNSMITKSLPMEVLYAISPRTGISDALKVLGFNAKLSAVFVVWLHSSQEPGDSQRTAFEKLMQQNGNRLPLSRIKDLRNLSAISDFYEFSTVPERPPLSPEWTTVLTSYVTSKIATKE